MRAVATAAGVGLSNLQFHYANKQAVLIALLDEELRVGEQLVAEAVAIDDGWSVRSRGREALLHQRRDLDTMNIYLSLWSFAAHDEILRKAVSSFSAQYVEQIVAAFVGCGPADLPHRARVAVALLEGASLFRSGVAGLLDAGDDAVLQRTLHHLLTGAAEPASGPTDR
jgi:AcrR family transcriptional regulator